MGANKKMKKNNIIILVLFVAFCLFFYSGIKAEDYPPTITFEKPVKAVPFNHKGHIEMMGQDCESCHEKFFQYQIGAAADAGDFNHKSFKEGKYCGGCHDGGNAFAMDKECTKCHIGVKGYNKLKSGGKKEEAHH
jgi:c(7)-type cytochrome triheme protein